jgi:LytR cell envelope-related transcriptional attenuator
VFISRALKTLLTLTGLALMLAAGVAWGFNQVTKPFPGKVEVPVCVDTKYKAGDQLSPQDVTVSVLNASAREGLATLTSGKLHDQGFAIATTGNAPKGTSVATAEIWVSDKTNPAIPLVRSRVGKVPVRERSNLPLGIVVVVGDQFGELQAGLPTLTAKKDGVVCSPPVD